MKKILGKKEIIKKYHFCPYLELISKTKDRYARAEVLYHKTYIQLPHLTVLVTAKASKMVC
jgi:predicted transglutaminase-like protease